MAHDVPSIFATFEPPLARLAQRCGTLESYARGQRVVSEGDPPLGMYFVVEGRVRAFLTYPEGREVTLTTQGPGEYFGEISLVDDGPRSASVEAAEDSLLCFVSREAFRVCIEREPGLSMALLRDACRRIRMLTEGVRNFALLDVQGRVGRLLVSLASDRDGTLVVDQRLTQQDIANRVGASREMVSRVLQGMVAQGYLARVERRWVLRATPPIRTPVPPRRRAASGDEG